MNKLFTIFEREATASAVIFTACIVLLLICLGMLLAAKFGIFGLMIFLSVIAFICAIIIINSEED